MVCDQFWQLNCFLYFADNHIIIIPLRPPLLAASMVEDLTSALPGFLDEGSYADRKLQFNRKAQTLVAALAAKFGGTDSGFAFTDTNCLKADSGRFGLFS